MNKTEIWSKLNEWLATYESAYGYVFFNAVIVEEGRVSVSSVPTQRIKKEDILGNKTIGLTFMVHMIKSYDTEMSDTNEDAMQDALLFMEWIEEQDKAKNYPNIDNVNYIKLLANAPTIMVDNENNLAQYNFQCELEYTERND